MFLFRVLTVGVLGYIGYRNRFRIQQFLESRGIKTPFLKGNLGEVVQSGLSKISGKSEKLGHDLDDQTRRAS